MTLYLAGGGSADQESQVWRRALTGVDQLLYWPFALPDERLPLAESWLRASLESLAIDVQVHTWLRLDGHRPSELTRYELLFVGGGLTSKLAAHIHEHGFTQRLRSFVREGGHYYGGSAGAILAGDSVGIAALLEDDPDAVGMPGLGLVPDLAIFPHADRHHAGRPGHVAAELGTDVLALSEASGVVVEGDRLSAIGPGTVRIVTPTGGRTPIS